jgi:hypothetical protein
MDRRLVKLPARAETRDALDDLARARGSTAIDVLDQLVAGAREEWLLSSLPTSLARHAPAIANETICLDAFDCDGLNPSDEFADW